MIKPPILEALKVYGTHFNVKDFISLPTNTPYGNLNLTYTQIVVRVELLNEAIIDLYQEFYNHQENVKASHGASNPDKSFKHKFQIEQVIYWLRKTADELISILSILYYYKKEDLYPNKIPLPSIGKFLNLEEREHLNLEAHIKLFSILNEISNAYKHTLINAQVSLHRGRHEPVVFALAAYNQTGVIPNFHSVGLRALLDTYNKFLLTVRSDLESNYQTSIVTYAPYYKED